MLRSSNWLLLLSIFAAVGCSSGEASAPAAHGGHANGAGKSGSGGVSSLSGGTSGLGGANVASGGSATQGFGGAQAGAGQGGGSLGGAAPGGTSSAGTTSAGGTSSSGGGGASGAGASGGGSNGGGASGGASTAGSSNGGVSASGGASKGGSMNGGSMNGGTGTTAGGLSNGGTTASGGTVSGGTSGGSASTGGSSAAGASSGGAGAGSCSRPVGSCTAPTVKVSDVSLGIPVTAYGAEGDTDPLPMAIAAKPSGGSRIAWLGTDKKVYVGELDCDDKLVGTPFSFPAIDLQDLYADDSGGVVLLTREATGSGTDHCGSGMLCGGTSSPCREMFMVRFNSSGQVTWETEVTNLSASLDGYENGARFVWWYQHHGRLAFDGTNYAAYFGVAITVNNGSCVDIHEGDRMQVVSSSGALLTGHDSFEYGCSHAWTSRIVWDPRTNHFVMVCATDNSCRIARPNPYRTIASGTCDGTLFGGDVVLSSTTGYWTAWSQGGTVRLQHFTDSGPDTAISNAGSAQHPHLVAYGTGRMLLSWASGASLIAQVRSSGAAGETIGSTFTIPVNDHSYQAFKAYPDGSVAYPAAGANSTSVKVARVMPCN